MRFAFWCAPLLGLLLVVVWPQVAVAQSEQNSCITCHKVLPDERLSAPAEKFSEDIHATEGFICIACHGGDATIVGPGAMDPAKGYIGLPKREQVPELCGRCHSNAQFMRRFNPALRVDQVAEFETSVHGQRLLSDGDPNVATCTSCHTVHSIKPASDPRSSVHPLRVPATCGRCHADAERMARYNIPTNQLEQYQTSIHWETISEDGDLSAPTCNDCHGNHGAAPPGLSWVGNVCAQCHSMMAELFNESRHSRVFARATGTTTSTRHRTRCLGLERGRFA
jgi:bacterioferritin-associated ferredoxin